jgi:adenylate cyclase
VSEDHPRRGDDSKYWAQLLGGHDPQLDFVQRAFSKLPSPPRCKLCMAPFTGPFAPLLRLVGFRRWALNQQLCRFCIRDLEKHRGGAEVAVSLLYVDIRGSTELAEQMSPAEFTRGLQRYLALVGAAVDAESGVIDHMAGDGVMAMWIPGFVGSEHPMRAMRAAFRVARDIAAAVKAGEGFPAGVGAHTGHAYVGVVGEPGARDFTVVGDTANTTARLSAGAAPGEVVLSQALIEATRTETAALQRRNLQLKGKAEPFDAWIWTTDAPTPVDLDSR